MEKGFKNLTNLPTKPQHDRIRQIQQKLQYITQTKTLHLRQQKLHNTNNRVSTIQKSWNQLSKKLQAQIRQHKDQLRELNRQYQENKSEQDIVLRNRVNQVGELQGRIVGVWRTQLQRAKDNQRKLIVLYEERVESLRLAVFKETEKRKQYFLTLDEQLSQKLPSLQSQICQQLNTSSNILISLHNQLQAQTEQLCKDIKQAQQKQLASFQQLMKMMSSVIGEVKEEIKGQKQCRENSYKKLLGLFQDAYVKLAE